MKPAKTSNAPPTGMTTGTPSSSRWSLHQISLNGVGMATKSRSAGTFYIRAQQPKYLEELNKALSALEESNPDTLEDVLKAIDFNKQVGKKRGPESDWRRLIKHFNRYRLRNR